MKIGLFGGSFDPVHWGHLLSAQDAVEDLDLDRLVFIPAAQAPLKSADVRATGEARVALLRAAVDGDARFEVSDWEVRQGGVSYSVETARHFRAVWPDAKLFWLIGADQLAKLSQWREIAELARLVEFAVHRRPGFSVETPTGIPGLKLHACRGREVELSSTEIRERARAGQPIDWFLPHKAVEQLQKMALYRA